MHLCERNTSNNPIIIRAFVDAVLEARQNGLLINTDTVGELAKYLNLLGGIYILDMIYVGRATEKKLANYGIHTIGDIAATPPETLKGWFGVNGLALWQYASGNDSSRVMHQDFVSPVKSIGHGITCVADLDNEEEVWRVMLELSQDIGHKLRLHKLVAGGVQITVKNRDLAYKQYQALFSLPTRSPQLIAAKARELFHLPKIIQVGMDIVMAIGNAIIENLPTLVECASTVIMTFLEGLIEALPTITEGALQLVLTLVQGIIDNLPAIIEAAIQMIITLATGLAEALPELVPSIVEAIILICQTLIDNLDLILDAAFQIIAGLAQGILNHVQAEFSRRKSLGRSYSGKDTLCAKLICEDCSGFYGRKVWHSTDAYKREIWQCNSKFKNGERCGTPTLTTEDIQRRFIKAYNRQMTELPRVIADCELMRKSLIDFRELDAAIEQKTQECDVIAGMVKALVNENATTAVLQDEYMRKYESLNQRFESVIAELNALNEERTRRQQQDKAMGLYIRTLKKSPQLITEWNDAIWTVMVEKAVVHRDGGVTFVFYNGTKKNTPAQFRYVNVLSDLCTA